MTIQGKKPLGQLLCEKDYLDPTRLEQALSEQRVQCRRLGEILVDLGYITQLQLNEALALQAGIERIDLTGLSISADIIGLIPAELVNNMNVLPLWMEGQRLAVAMIDPFQIEAVEELRLVTGCSIRRYYGDPVEMENAILRFYGSHVARMLDDLVPDEWQGTALPMALISIALAILSVGNIPGIFYKAIGRPDILNQISMVKIPVLIGIIWVGAHWGIVGVAAGQIIFAIISIVFESVVVSRIIDFNLSETIQPLIPATICSGAMALTTTIAKLLFNLDGVLGFIVVIVIAGGTFLSVLSFVDRTLMNQIIRTVKKRKTVSVKSL